MKVAVTGGTGSWDRGLGPVVIAALKQRGHEVTNLDRAVPGGIERPGFIRVDLTDYGQTFAALHGHDAVVQLAANGEPDWDHVSGAARFHVNTLIAYNVFQAACFLGMKKVVWASSETVLGFPFDIPPKVLPTSDDDPPIPTSSYGISKAVTEELARHMSRRYGVPFVGLRFSNIFYDTPGHTTSYERIPSFWDDPHKRKFDLWAYVDSRDTAESCVQALESDITGAEVMTIAAPDTLMPQTNAELVAAAFPGCTLRPGTGDHDTLISINKARSLIGYDPQWTWRRVLGK
jgi:nucleoside-diphosphate-sugar epimerase